MRFAKTIMIALAACSIALPAAASADAPATVKSDATASPDGTASSIRPQTGNPASSGGKAYSIQPQTGSRVPVADDEPNVIEVVRPQRTIVRDVDEALPLILSGTALVLVLAGVGFTLIRTGAIPRPGRSH